MESFQGSKKPTLNLSLFTAFADSFSGSNSSKSPRDFGNGVVGLGIVAAMTDLSKTHEPIFSAKSPRSRPIPIVSTARPVVDVRGGMNMEIENSEVDELSENYTRMISHLGNNVVKKRVYFDDNKLENGCVFFASSSPMNSVEEVIQDFESGNFLSYCALCKKQLHGLDIFMYRGEKAFCSAECRDKHIRSDNNKERCGSEAKKQIEYSIAPCSGPQVIFSGVAAA